MPSRFQTMKCAASDDCTTSHRVDAGSPYSCADALEHALGAGALDAHARCPGYFASNALRDPLGERQVDRGVADDLAFLLAPPRSAPA